MSDPQKDTFYLGVDGGATKTHVIIGDDQGNMLSEVITRGSNIHNVSIETAGNQIVTAIKQAQLQMYRKHRSHIPEHIHFTVSCLGLSGLDTASDRIRIKSFFRQYFNHDPKPLHVGTLIIVNDGYIGLRSATTSNRGICLIAGTGSNCYGLNEMGDQAIAGDWGYLLGDEGSAFALGQKMLRVVIKEYDGRKVTSIVSQKVLDYLELETVEELINWSYQKTVPVEAIARVSRLLNDPELIQLPLVRGMVAETIEALLAAYKAVIKQLTINSDEQLPVVLIGGLFSHKKLILQPIKHHLKKITPHALIKAPKQSPAHGAVRVASIYGKERLVMTKEAVILNGK